MYARLTFVIFIAIVSAGCASPMKLHTPYAVKEDTYHSAPPLELSLFKGDKEVISDEDLKRILSSELRLPKKVRVAVFKLPTKQTTYYSFWSEAYLKLEQGYIDTLSSKISSSERVNKIIFLPSIMKPKEANIALLREAAVRLQADTLLVFQITSDLYSEYKMFSENKAKAYSTCEALLLDVRTGLIPFSSVVTQEQLELQRKEDLDIMETRQRAEKQAVLKALNVIGGQIVEFFQSVPEGG